MCVNNVFWWPRKEGKKRKEKKRINTLNEEFASLLLYKEYYINIVDVMVSERFR